MGDVLSGEIKIRVWGIARCICLTNAKLAIKTEERANRFIAEMLSLFLLFS